MWRLTGVGFVISGFFFVVTAAVMAAASALPVSGQVAYITTATRARGGQLMLMDVDRRFRHHLFTLPTNVTQTAFAPDGRRLAFVVQRFDELSRLYVSDLNGLNPVNVSGAWGFNDYPAWSPDSRRLAFISTGSDGDFPHLYVVNVDGTGLRRLSDLPMSFQRPAWSPDGTRLAFVAGGLHVADAQTGDLLLRLNPLGGSYNNLAWSPDGTRLAFTAFTGAAVGAYVVDADGANLRRLTPAALDVRRLNWSPDGTRLAVMAFAADNSDIYLVDAGCRLSLDGRLAEPPDCHQPRQLTTSVGFDWLPAWSPDGTRLMFVSYDDRLSQLRLLHVEHASLHGLVGQAVSDFQPAWLTWDG